jgi:uncharacterized membrane protein
MTCDSPYQRPEPPRASQDVHELSPSAAQPSDTFDALRTQCQEQKRQKRKAPPTHGDRQSRGSGPSHAPQDAQEPSSTATQPSSPFDPLRTQREERRSHPPEASGPSEISITDREIQKRENYKAGALKRVAAKKEKYNKLSSEDKQKEDKKLSEAARKGKEIMGAEKRSEATHKGHVTRRIDQVLLAWVLPEKQEEVREKLKKAKKARQKPKEYQARIQQEYLAHIQQEELEHMDIYREMQKELDSNSNRSRSPEPSHAPQDTHELSSTAAQPLPTRELDQLEERRSHSPKPSGPREMGDQHQQNPHPERLTKGQASSQQEAPFPQAAEAVSEQADEAKCHQIVEHLMNPQERKRLPPLTQDEHQRIRKMLDEKHSKGAIDDLSYKKVIIKLKRKIIYERKRDAIHAKDAPFPQAAEVVSEQADEAKCHQIVEHLMNPQEKKRLPLTQDEHQRIRKILDEKHSKGAIDDLSYKKVIIKLKRKIRNEEKKISIHTKYDNSYEEKKGVIRAKDAKRYKENRDAILARNAKWKEENRDVIHAKDAKHYEKNRDAIRARKTKHYEKNRDAIRVKDAKWREYLRDPHNLIEFLVRTLQKAKDKHDQESAALQHEIQSLSEQRRHAPAPEQVAEQERLLAEKRTRLVQTQLKWNALRAKKEKTLAKTRRLVEIHGEFVALVQQVYSHAHQQEATDSSEMFPLRPIQDQMDLSDLRAVAHETPTFEQMYDQLRPLLQAPHQADQLQVVEHCHTEYQSLHNQLDEELETILASFHELDTFEPGDLF